MVERKPADSKWQALLDITLVPASARLPQAVPADRRNAAARHALLCRIRSEFEEMPGMFLTSPQASKLFGLAPDVASRVLVQLTEARVLRQRSDGQFARRREEL